MASYMAAWGSWRTTHRRLFHIKPRPTPAQTFPQPRQCWPVTQRLENVSRTMLKEAAACSRRPTKPDSLKYFPAQIPSSSGDKMSSDTADSSRTLEEMFCSGG